MATKETEDHLSWARDMLAAARVERRKQGKPTTGPAAGMDSLLNELVAEVVKYMRKAEEEDAAFAREVKAKLEGSDA